MPNGIYTVTAPYVSDGGLGDITEKEVEGGMEVTRMEMPSATFSFTFCSQDRTGPEGKPISGADEAEPLASRAAGYFLHAGYDDFTKCGIVIADVTEVHGRNALMGNEEANRKGFDVICNYINGVSRDISVVDKVMAGREKDERRGSVCQSG